MRVMGGHLDELWRKDWEPFRECQHLSHCNHGKQIKNHCHWHRSPFSTFRPIFPRPIFTRPIFSQNIVKTKESHCISHCNRWIFREILLLPVPALSQKALFRKTQEKIGPMMENGEADCKIVFQPPKIFLIIYRRLSTQLSTNKRLSGKKMEPNMFPKLFASDGLRNLVCLSIEYLASRLRG